MNTATAQSPSSGYRFYVYPTGELHDWGYKCNDSGQIIASEYQRAAEVLESPSWNAAINLANELNAMTGRSYAVSTSDPRGLREITPIESDHPHWMSSAFGVMNVSDKD